MRRREDRDHRPEHASPDHPIVANHDAGNRAQKRCVAAEPSEDKCLVVVQQLPGHDGDTHEAGNYAAGLEADFARPEIGKVIRRRNHIGADIHVQRRQQNGNQRDDHCQRRMKSAQSCTGSQIAVP